MRSHRWRSVQSGLPESAHGCPELVKHALLVEANGMCRNTDKPDEQRAAAQPARNVSGDGEVCGEEKTGCLAVKNIRL